MSKRHIDDLSQNRIQALQRLFLLSSIEDEAYVKPKCFFNIFTVYIIIVKLSLYSLNWLSKQTMHMFTTRIKMGASLCILVTQQWSEKQHDDSNGCKLSYSIFKG